MTLITYSCHSVKSGTPGGYLNFWFRVAKISYKTVTLHFLSTMIGNECIYDFLYLRLIWNRLIFHYGDVIMGNMASPITSLTIVYSTVYSGADQRKHQSSASLAFVRGIHRGPVNSPHKWPVTRKMFPFDDVIMNWDNCSNYRLLLHDETYMGSQYNTVNFLRQIHRSY